MARTNGVPTAGVPAPRAAATQPTAQPGPAVADPSPPLDPVARLEEKVRSAVMAGQVSFLPYLDPYTEETPEMRRLYPVMLRNGVVKQSLQHKVQSVAALDLQVVPAAETVRDHEVADFVRYALADAIEGGFPALCEEVLYPALIWKSVVAEKVWYPELWPRGAYAGKRFYRAVKAKEMAEPVYDEFRNIVGVRALGYGQSETFEPDDFIILKNWPLFGGPGMSDLRAAYRDLWQLDTVQTLNMIHLEKFLTPVLVASYDERFDHRADGAKLEADLKGVRARNWLKVPESVKIEALQLAVRGEAEFLEKCKDLREQIALSITGAYLQMLTATSGGDIRGNARVQNNTSELLVWALAARLAGTLNTQFAPQITRENYGNVDYPKVVLGAVSYQELLQSIQIDGKAQQMGANLSARAFARKYSLQLAASPADVMVPIPTAAGPAGPGGPGGPDPGMGAGFGDPPPGDPPPGGEGLQSFCGGPGSGVPGPCPEGTDQYKPGSGAGKLYRARSQQPPTNERYAMRSRLAQRYQDLGKPMVMDDRAAKAMAELDPGGGLSSTAALARDILHADASAHEEAIPLFNPATNDTMIAVASATGHTEKLYLEPGMGGATRVSGSQGTATIPAGATHAEAARLIYRAAGIRPPREVRANLRKPAAMADPPHRRRGPRFRRKRRRFALNLNALLLGSSSFNDPPPGPAPHPVALGGADGQQAEALLARAQREGATVLHQLVTHAVGRLVRRPPGAPQPKALFTARERRRLARALAATLAPAHLLGAARIRRRADQAATHDRKRAFRDVATDLRCFDEAGTGGTGGLEPMAPAEAVAYFRRLVPGLDLDAADFAARIGAEAFTLAVTTDQTLLDKIAGIIAERLDTGAGLPGADDEVQAVLDMAGVAPHNPQYSEMVVRTNMMQAYNTGAQRELAGLADVFPVWEYHNPDDSRSRPTHAERSGRYWPADRAFTDVRGTDAEDVCNCRCTFVPIDARDWADLQAGGATEEYE